MTNEEVFDVILATVRQLKNERRVPPLQLVEVMHAASVAVFQAVATLPEGAALLRTAIVDYQSLLADATSPGGRVNQ